MGMLQNSTIPSSAATRNARKTWGECLEELSLGKAQLLAVSPYDSGRRVYRQKDKVFKVVLWSQETTSSARANTPEEEREILRRCSNVRGVPRVLGSHTENGHDVTILERIPGSTLSDLERSIFGDCRHLLRVSRLLIDLSRCGVIHDDLVLDNVLIDPEGRAHLVDFDQAKTAPKLTALRRNFFGSLRSTTWESPMVRLARITLKKDFQSLGIRLRRSLAKRIAKPAGRLGWRVAPRFDPKDPIRKLPDLQQDASDELQKLRMAWQLAKVSDANYPGADVAYYELDYEGHLFPGERPWKERWDQLKTVTDFRGKRVLELGCNLSLLSCYLQKYGGVSASACVDHDQEILSAAQLVSEVFDASCTYHRIDFDSPDNWEETLAGFKPDVVTALSVMNWVEDKQRLFDFLGRFDEVIFEGHDSVESEKEQFRKRGFAVVAELVSPDRQRPLLHCKKGSTADA